MVRVRRPQALQDRVANIGLVVAVGVFQKQQVGTGSHQHTTAPKLESQRVVNVRKDLSLVGNTVAIGVLKDHQAVFQVVAGLPLRIRIPTGRPQSPFPIDLQLHGIGKVGEHFFGSENVQLESRPAL